jgi:pyruvate dehydrogenase E2 component (dihydrolipoamide acetyltransferase)
MGEFRMPSLGADMKTGTLMAWRVKQGDRVRHGDIIAEVETDKGLFEVEVFEDGMVEQFLFQPVAKVPVGTVLATIRSEKPPAEAPGAAPSGRVKASPAARKLAADLGMSSGRPPPRRNPQRRRRPCRRSRRLWPGGSRPACGARSPRP